MNRRALVSIFIFLGTIGIVGASKRGATPAAALEEAKRMVQQKDYEKAASSLEAIFSKYRLPKEAEEAFPLLTESEIRLGHLKKAQYLIDHFFSKYPYSKFASRMKYYQGVLYLKQNQNFPAAEIFVSVLNSTKSEPVYVNANQYLVEIVQSNGLRLEELSIICERLKFNKPLMSQMMLKLGYLQESQKLYSEAAQTFGKWLKLFKGERKKEVKKKHKELKKLAEKYKTLLIMLPITGAYAEVGKILLQGILLRLDPYFNNPELGLKYKVLDTEGDPIKAINLFRSAAKMENVLGVIGPAMSDVSLALAAELSGYEDPIPMVTPTATTDGIAQLGPNIFQLNVTTYTLGNLIADYAVNCKKYREFAILAPNSDYGVELSETFEKMVRDAGGVIIAKQFYNPEEKDFAGYFKVIRTRKAKSFLSKKWRGLNRSTNPVSQKELNAWVKDSMLNIQGLFIPANDGEEAYLLSSQAKYHKINTKIFGSSGWYDREIFNKRFRHTKGTVFSTDYFQEVKSAYKENFETSYLARWHEKPDKLAVLGFDAATFVIEGLKKSKKMDLLKGLKKMESFIGVNHEIKIDSKGGFNKSAVLVEIESKTFSKLYGCGEEPPKEN